MPDFPLSPSLRNPISIGTFSLGSIIVPMMAAASASSSSTVWPSANLAIYIPIEIRYPVTIANISVNNGTAVSGNIDVGIYDAGGARLVSSGSTAQAGTSAIQTFNITDTYLVPGLYYMAVALDNGTGTLAGWGVIALETRPSGVCQQASAFALPATFTLAAFAQTFLPLISLTPKTTI